MELEYVRFRIGMNCTATIIFTGRVTQEAIDKLIRILELQRDTFPKAERPKTIDDSDLSRPPIETSGGVLPSVAQEHDM